VLEDANDVIQNNLNTWRFNWKINW
jgi:hypothetical protein